MNDPNKGVNMVQGVHSNEGVNLGQGVALKKESTWDRDALQLRSQHGTRSGSKEGVKWGQWVPS